MLVCEESTAQEQSLYDKLSTAADFRYVFEIYSLTELCEVVSFTSYRLIFRGSGHFSAQ